jgi:putative copper export protein
MEMSGLGITAIFPVLPTVLFKTHYGSMWFVRVAGITSALAVWWAARHRPQSRVADALMLLAGAAIAFSRSASGHSADYGDLSPQQLANWLHLLAVSSWGGALVTIAAVFPPAMVAGDDGQQRTVAGVADRFYVLFGPAFALLVLTGLYNAWFLVGGLRALVTTPYGGLLSAKLVLLLLLTVRYIAPPEHGRDESFFAMRFLHRTRVEVIFFVGILLCVAVLVHRIPARHQSHVGHTEHSGGHAEHHVRHDVPGPEPIASLETTPAKVLAGSLTTMRARIRQADGKPFKGLAVSHERMLHAIIVGRDLSIFAHIHPEDVGQITDEMLQKADFPLVFTFPKAGEYLVGLDFATAEESYSKTVSLNVAGEPKMGEPKIDFSTRKTFGEYLVTLTTSPETLQPGRETTLRYTVERGGKTVTHLEPYLGAAMHLAVVSADLKLFIHTHGVTPGEFHSHGDHMHASPPKHFGPEIDASIIFPEAGIYKVFGQTKHDGKVLLFDFTVNVGQP